MAEPPRTDEFYVNYLPTPPALRRVLVLVTGLLLWVAAAYAFVWARAQHGPGDAVWDDVTPKTFTGTLVADPYPMLLPESAAEPSAATSAAGGVDPAMPIILVEMGKHGSRERVTPHAGRRVTVRGWTLERDGRRVVELDPADDAITPAEGVATVPAAVPAGPVTLAGEIVDYKCFLGAMKPGEGKPHKMCATLCVRGGIPPMLVVNEPAGRAYYLLTGPAGEPIGEGVLPFIADPVEVRGSVEARAGLRLLRINPDDIRRR